jgi:FAD/FMN-containing dehydrogenase
MAIVVTDAASLAEVVREARTAGTPLRVSGGGTWMDAGRPTHALRTVSLAGISGVVEYVPGDLTITVLAGTTHADLEAVTAAENQWIPLDPAGAASGTIGATIATGSAGPLSGSLGLPRDVVLGIDAVLGQGDVIRAGGRVVKNVAGFDLVRLLTGSWGTLGIITAVTLRLRARPEMDETIALPVPDSASGLAELLQRVARLPIAMSACELVSPALASRLGVGDGSCMLVRLMGSEASVRAQLNAATSALADVRRCPREVWDGLAEGDPPSASAVRWSAARTNLPVLWQAARAAESALDRAMSHATVARGVVRQVARAPDENLLLAAWSEVGRTVTGGRVTTVGERLPASVWPILCPSAVDDRLSRGVREAFDPDRLLNRGILGEATPDAGSLSGAGMPAAERAPAGAIRVEVPHGGDSHA